MEHEGKCNSIGSRDFGKESITKGRSGLRELM
jgi:hypothetical protein